MSFHLDRSKLSRARPENLLRLARALGFRRQWCRCRPCHVGLVEWVARRVQ